MTSEAEYGVAALQFTKVRDYTTFDAEYAVVGDDIVFHFFLPDDQTQVDAHSSYWLKQFPGALEQVAQSYWEATYPRLKAAYTEELSSWWLRCYGFANNGDPELRAQRFLEKLDEALPNPGLEVRGLPRTGVTLR